ncbi:unnamed protein product [Caenorhabditis auriculariae]|uniref:Uncharacterized protein n=1 Tax=Caenorhabditis auriculariae TaxID=2777116 RepID=A0A8S1HHM9_9PELO|nr:unnamed protein product [Caenorhabditis auriculariae]
METDGSVTDSQRAREGSFRLCLWPPQDRAGPRTSLPISECSDFDNSGKRPEHVLLVWVQACASGRAARALGLIFRIKPAWARAGRAIFSSGPAKAGPGLRNGRGAGRVTSRPSHKPVWVEN